jgi:hypothetical protein
MVRLLTIPFFIFWIIFSVLWNTIALIVMIRSRRSRSWLQTIGTVVYTEVRGTESSGLSNDMLVDSTSYEPYIKYAYSVGGRECENDKFTSAVASGIRDPAGAEDILRGYPVGSQVAVFYNPLSPEDSVLVPGESRGNVYFLLIGFLIFAVGVIGLINQW